MTTDIAVLVGKPATRGWPPELDKLVAVIGQMSPLAGGYDFAHQIREALAVADAILPHRAAVLRCLQAACQPASREEMSKCLALLVAAYPNAGSKGDLTVFGRMLVEDVASLEPSIAAVDKACRELRQTKAFVPAIAEVITAVRGAGKQLDVGLSLLEKLDELLERGQRHIADIRRQEEVRAHRERRTYNSDQDPDQTRADQKRDIQTRMRLRMDVTTGGHPADLVRDCLAEWERQHGKAYEPTYRPLGGEKYVVS